MNDSEQRSRSKVFKKLFLSVLILFLIFSGFLAGFTLGVWRGASARLDLSLQNIIKQAPLYLESSESKTSLFWQVWQSIQEKYVDQIPAQEKLFYGAIKGLVQSLNDPYSIFLDPEMSKEFTKELSGEFEGIGTEIGMKDGQLTIIAPLPDSPAEKAGLKAGDKILKIDDKETANMDIDYAISLIRGKKGTKVTMTILRVGAKTPEAITITRDKIKIKSVTWSMKNNNIAYINVSYFNNDTSALFKKAVNEIMPKSPSGIILDLRNNPGGYLDAAVDIASYFIENGQIIVIEELGKGERRSIKSQNTPALKGLKTVVIVNEGSASGSEIVAGALQNYKIAPVVGKKTFGKGTVQDLEEFSDGSSLKLTIARWLTPSGRSIENEGITPDYEVDLTEEDYNKDRDPQLDKALELLQTS